MRHLLKTGIMAFALTAAVFLWGTFHLEGNNVYAQAEISEKSPREKNINTEKLAPEPAKEAPLLPPPPQLHPETFRMIETIEKKNRELKRREEELKIKEQQLKILEGKILADLEKIEIALARSEEQLGIQNERIRENINALVKAYSSMKPNEAAQLLEAINEDLAIQIVAGMKAKAAGKVLSQLDVKVAKNISEKMAGKRRKK